MQLCSNDRPTGLPSFICPELHPNATHLAAGMLRATSYKWWIENAQKMHTRICRNNRPNEMVIWSWTPVRVKGLFGCPLLKMNSCADKEMELPSTTLAGPLPMELQTGSSGSPEMGLFPGRCQQSQGTTTAISSATSSPSLQVHIVIRSGSKLPCSWRGGTLPSNPAEVPGRNTPQSRVNNTTLVTCPSHYPGRGEGKVTQ